MHSRRRLRPATVAPKPPAARRLQCVCGSGFDVLPEHAGWKGLCPGCRRGVEIHISREAGGGSIVSLAYLKEPAGTSSSSTAAETSTELPAPEPGKAGALTAAGLAAVQDPPDEAQFRCACGALLSITRDCYDHRVKCPKCGGRHLVTLAVDASSGGYTLHTFGLQDSPSGTTRLALRLA